MADFAEVKSKPGLHYDFQLGIRITAQWKEFDWPKHLYNGCAVRAFFFSGKNPTGGIYIKYNSWYHIYPAIANGEFLTLYGDKSTHSGRHLSKDGLKVEKNTYFSIGVIIQGTSFGSLFGKEIVTSRNMGGIIGYKWTININAGSMLLTSFHIYDEIGRHFPSHGLGQVYVGVDHGNFFHAPIGSSVTVELVFQGQPNDIVTVVMEKGGLEAAYTDVPLNTNDPFTVIVVNTVNGWEVTVSFEGPTQTSRLIPHNSTDNLTRPMFSLNCYITRIHAVCAPFPPHHRH